MRLKKASVLMIILIVSLVSELVVGCSPPEPPTPVVMTSPVLRTGVVDTNKITEAVFTKPNPSSTQLPSETATVFPTTTIVPTSTDTPAPTATSTPQPFVGIKIENVDIHSGPGEAFPVVASYTKDLKFALIGKSKDGAYLVLDLLAGQTGWVPVEEVEIFGETVVIPEVESPPTPTKNPLPVLTISTKKITGRNPQGGSFAYVRITVNSVGTYVKFTLEIISPEGKTVYHKEHMTGKTGSFYYNYWTVGAQVGEYIAIATTLDGKSVRTKFTVDRLYGG